MEVARRIFFFGCTALLALASAVRAETLTIVGFGDSLMSGHELSASDAFPVRLEAALKEKGHDVAVTNASVSGDTSTGGLARLDWSVPAEADAVLLELGANDALRGIDPDETRRNLDAMIARLKSRGTAVLLVGMLAPPNMGEAYATAFNRIYPELAERHGIPLYPFFLDGVAARPGLDIGDGMHPNSRGVEVMVARFLPFAEDLITGLKDAGVGVRR